MSKSKVTRVIEKYDLADMGAKLQEAWTGDGGERTSLRGLADEFNRAVVEASLRENGVTSISFEIDGIYEALRDAKKAETTRTKRYLEREGIDPDELRSDFVTHQTIHTYLRNERDVQFSKGDEELADRKIETIEKLQGRIAAVTESAVSSLASAGELDQGGYEILVDVRAVCPKCRSDYPVTELLDDGGCKCNEGG